MFLVPLSRHAQDLSRSVDRLFDDGFLDRFFAPGPRSAAVGTRSPALDVTETEREYAVKLDLPGVSKDQVKIAIDGRLVTVEAQTSNQQEKKEGERVIYSERSSATYARSFTLPVEINEAESSAKLDQGVLTLTLTKRGAGSARQINVS